MIGKNIAVIRGNITRKPLVRYTPEKYPVAFFTIAEDYSVRTEEKGWETRVNFIDVIAFGPIADRAGKSLDKGYAVECECKLKPRVIEDNQSGKKYRTNEVIAHRITVLAKTRTETPATETGNVNEPETIETNAKQPDITRETHEEIDEEEEGSPEDYISEEDELHDDDETFNEFLIKYDKIDQMLEIAARNPAHYQ